ncbi:hypothetical protein GE061_014664 [Apolygus lucorum]|uniref:Uncharacterized protein n=1 Tax=Apolygus lucorum TaxID=248454 RepID=A0A8S9XIV0_APOLU|nr:hypothetical protein GE061_014664 [Apolygus lucorum]
MIDIGSDVNTNYRTADDGQYLVCLVDKDKDTLQSSSENTQNRRMGASHSRYGRSTTMSESNSSQSVIVPLGAKPRSINLRGVNQGHGESPSAVMASGSAGSSELGDGSPLFAVAPPATVFVADSGEDPSEEYLTIFDDETGLALQDVNFHSCTSFPSGLGSRHQLQCPPDLQSSPSTPE